MLIGIENFGGMPNSQFDTRLSRSKYDYIKVENGTYDEMICDEDTTIAVSTSKREWGNNTIFLATFDNTFECGNIQVEGSTIEKLRFKKRLTGDVDWILLEELDYSKTNTLYKVEDKLAYSLDEYEYAVVPVIQDIEGDYSTNTIECTFDGLWIVDRYNSAKMLYNLDYGDIKHNRKINVIETIEGKFPIIHSTNLQYRSGSNSAVILSQETIDAFGKIKYLYDRTTVDTMVEFLGNRKPKILKDGNGRKYIIVVTDVNESTKDGFNGGVHTISIDWVEIGDADDFDTLVDNDLLPESLRS